MKKYIIRETREYGNGTIVERYSFSSDTYGSWGYVSDISNARRFSGRYGLKTAQRVVCEDKRKSIPGTPSKRKMSDDMVDTILSALHIKYDIITIYEEPNKPCEYMSSLHEEFGDTMLTPLVKKFPLRSDDITTPISNNRAIKVCDLSSKGLEHYYKYRCETFRGKRRVSE